MHLLSTACTAERREKSHYDDAGRQETVMLMGGRGLHNTDQMLLNDEQ